MMKRLAVAALALMVGCAPGYIKSTDLERHGQGPAACAKSCEDLGMRMTALVLVGDMLPGCVCQPVVKQAPSPTPAPTAPLPAPATPQSGAAPATTPESGAAPATTQQSGAAPATTPESGAAASTTGFVVIAAVAAAQEQQRQRQEQLQKH